MRKLALSVFTIIAFHALTFAQQEATTATGNKVLLFEDGTWVYADSVPLYYARATTISKLEIPETNPNDSIIAHTGFTLLYNEAHEQASWVAYEITKEETNRIYERTDQFFIDPKIKTTTASNKDYTGYGYDRGHLAPAADMGWSATVMAESFYFSNISPQTPTFNRGVWKRLEALVRAWAIENDLVYIVTGPVLTSGLTTIGLFLLFRFRRERNSAFSARRAAFSDSNTTILSSNTVVKSFNTDMSFDNSINQLYYPNTSLMPFRFYA